MYNITDNPEKADIDWDDQWNPRLELDNAVSTSNFDRKYEIRYFHTDTVDKIPHVVLSEYHSVNTVSQEPVGLSSL